MNKVTDLVWAKLGYCHYCMRSAFRVAVTASIIASVVVAYTDSQYFRLLSILSAAGLTGLWVAHLVVYSFKVAATSRTSGGRDSSSAAGPADLRFQNLARRSVLPGFARILGAAALGTALPLFSRTAFAQSGCTAQLQQTCGQRLTACQNSSPCKGGKCNQQCCVQWKVCMGQCDTSLYTCTN